MSSLRPDVVVLGAGIVGVGAALHLQARGRDVVLVDRGGVAGEGTSFGNSGIIERSSVFPYAFPRELRTIARYALNIAPEAHYHVRALPWLTPWLRLHRRHSSPEAARRGADAAYPLVERCLVEHEALMEAAGATHLYRKIGWLKVYRTSASLQKAIRDAERARPYGVAFDILDSVKVHALEPALVSEFAGGIHLLDPGSVSDPGALVKAYAALFVSRGGRFVDGDARTFRELPDGWGLDTAAGRTRAPEAVVALGPWSHDLVQKLGYRLPLVVKRGYHMHFGMRGGASLQRPVLDWENGFVAAPMARGIRITTGAEFARRDAPPSPLQMARAEIAARKMLPLTSVLDDKPWMGSRPCLPDLLPVIGPAPRHPGLWFDFGHQHHGLTIGPVCGRLLAEMMTGETPFTDPAPYAATRFG